MRYTELLEATIKSVLPPQQSDFSPREIKQTLSKLSDTERQQLGTPGFISTEDWPRFRKFLLDKSTASNPSLNPELTAYTPGETLKLLNNSEIVSWHNEIVSYVVPEEYSTVAFVPCAKTKPWAGASRGIYKSYNKIINDKKYPVYFVTVSEPLGIVPQSLWNDFPQYDNPGLFKDNVQRTGMFKSDWERLFGTGQQSTPFDPDAYTVCIGILSNVIKKFIANNKDKQFLSFVEDRIFNVKSKNVGTHSDMLTKTGSIPDANRFLKRDAPRKEPFDYIDSILSQKAKL